MALGAALVAAFAACSSSSSPADRCGQFLSLTQDCYAKAGQTVHTNPSACSDPTVVTPAVQAQIDCSLQYSSAYCRMLQASVNPDGGTTIDPRDPDLVALNACVAEATTKSPCKEAIAALAKCGAGVGFAPECTGTSAAMAQCIVDNPDSACAAIGGVTDAGSQAYQPYTECMQRALASDAGGD